MVDLHVRFVLAICSFALVVDGHGRLNMPPSRSTMWRFGFHNPPNYNDNQLFCGGAYVQWTLNGGKCGVCGDSFTGPRDNEAPHGEFANGVIVKKYEVGQLMEIKVHLTANHKGWFEYRLCQNDDPQRTVQQSCFDQHLLADKNGETRFMIQSDMKRVSHKVQLPYGLRCRNCVLQWKYNTGNSWGNDPITGNGCMGCGPQEQFYACADIAIGHDDITVGESDLDVIVPDGDVDEREEMNKTIDYNPDGTCMPCNCGQINTNTGSKILANSCVIVCIIMVSSLLLLIF